MKFRTTVNVVIFNQDEEVLICRQKDGNGVFPGQWAIPGGGIEDKERMIDALKREIKEEVGISITNIKPLHFSDDVRVKYRNGKKMDDIYMIYLRFTAKTKNTKVVLNDEHDEYVWASKDKISEYDLNVPTKDSFERLGWIRDKDQIQKVWVKYPTGKIGGGEFCGECGRYNVRNSTCTMIGVRDSKVLMILRANDPQKGFWSFPGGYLDWNETVEECAIREFKEESGYEVSSKGLLGVYSSPKRDLDERQNVDHCFYGEVREKVGEKDGEVEKVKWFELDKLPDKIAFDHREMIGDYISSQSRNDRNRTK